MDDMILLISDEEFNLYKDNDLELIYAKCLKQRLPSIEKYEQYVVKDAYKVGYAMSFIIEIKEKELVWEE